MLFRHEAACTVPEEETAVIGQDASSKVQFQGLRKAQMPYRIGFARHVFSMEEASSGISCQYDLHKVWAVSCCCKGVTPGRHTG